MSTGAQGPEAQHVEMQHTEVQGTDMQNSEIQRTDVQGAQVQRTHALTALLITIASACAVALIGAVAHRMGAASNIPYGLVLSLMMVAGSTYAARRRGGGLHVGVHLSISGLITAYISQTAVNTRALIIMGFAVDNYPYWTQYVGIWWMLGMVVVQLVILLLPRRWVFDSSSKQ